MQEAIGQALLAVSSTAGRSITKLTACVQRLGEEGQAKGMTLQEYAKEIQAGKQPAGSLDATSGLC